MNDDHDSTLPGPATLGSLAPEGEAGGAGARGSGGLAAARYLLRERIGRGGMGEVHAAHDVHVDREVAVKLLRSAAGAEAVSAAGAEAVSAAGAEAVARFLREARVQGRLEHPSIVPVHDLGLDAAGRPYFAMKRLAGTTLAEILAAHAEGDRAAAERWPRRALLGRLVDVCNAVEFAHRRGVVHRDLKPANIMLGDLGEAYVLDWGVARVVARDDGPGIRHSDLMTAAEVEAGHTVDGALLGTPGYMAPEQITGPAGVDARADVYALGCILFEVLTLRPALPRGMGAVGATLDAVAHHPRDRHPDADVPPELDAACAAATAPELADRLSSAGELGARIQAYLDGDRDLAHRRALAAEHVAAARAAFARGDDFRADAMRDAGRALALDPASAEAQQLLAGLLLQRPVVMPPAVRAAITAERVRAEQTQLRSAVLNYAGFLLTAPVFFVLGVRLAWPAIACISIIIAAIAVMWWQMRRAVPVARPLFYGGLAMHCALLAVAGVLFGPLLVLPLLAVGSTTAFSLTPTQRSPVAIVAGHALSVAAPLALELAGALPRTFTIDGAGLHVHPWAISAGGGTLIAILAMMLVAQLIATVIMIGHQHRAHDEAQEAVHVQSWHLHQLLG